LATFRWFLQLFFTFSSYSVSFQAVEYTGLFFDCVDSSLDEGAEEKIPI